MPQPMIIAGNWKMNGTRESARALAADIAVFVEEEGRAAVDVALFPPALLLQELAVFGYEGLKLGGQDCHAAQQGAHTGDVSAEMLVDNGADYVLVGHSERRQNYGESDATVQAKALAAKRAGLMPIICIGETLQQREKGEVEAVLSAQVKGSVPAEFGADDFVLAYEPIWAIGTGKTASIKEVAETHAIIAKYLPQATRILYGGSVKAANAPEILALQEVQGVLVGGASLQAREFNAIIGAAIAKRN